MLSSVRLKASTPSRAIRSAPPRTACRLDPDRPERRWRSLTQRAPGVPQGPPYAALARSARVAGTAMAGATIW